METQSTTGVEGRIWAMDEIQTPPLPTTPASTTVATKSISPPLSVTQHMEPPRSFVIVNAQGTGFMNESLCRCLRLTTYVTALAGVIPPTKKLFDDFECLGE